MEVLLVGRVLTSKAIMDGFVKFRLTNAKQRPTRSKPSGALFLDDVQPCRAGRYPTTPLLFPRQRRFPKTRAGNLIPL